MKKLKTSPLKNQRQILANYKKADQLCPSSLKDQLAVFVPFNEKIIKYAIDNWPSSDKNHRSANEKSHYYYGDDVYKKL